MYLAGTRLNHSAKVSNVFCCLWRIQHMEFRYSHIYREGNCFADIMANFGAQLEDRMWWSLPPEFASDAYKRDMSSLPFFRAT